MSVDIAQLRVKMSLTLADGVGVASFSSGVAYDNGQVVVSDPVPDNPAHALCHRQQTTKHKTKILQSLSIYFPRIDTSLLIAEVPHKNKGLTGQNPDNAAPEDRLRHDFRASG